MPIASAQPPVFGVMKDPNARFRVEVTVDEKDEAVWLSAGNKQIKVKIPENSPAEFTADIGDTQVRIAVAKENGRHVVRINGDVVDHKSAAEKFGSDTRQTTFANVGTGRGVGAIGLRFADVNAEQTNAAAEIVKGALASFVAKEGVENGAVPNEYGLRGTINGDDRAQIVVQQKLNGKIEVTIFAERLSPGASLLRVETKEALARVRELFSAPTTDRFNAKYSAAALALLDLR